MLQAWKTKLDFNMRQSQKQTEIEMGTWIAATFYILSGVTQPLIMTIAKQVGISNPEAQLYMVFYYLGPSLMGFFVTEWPSTPDTLKTCTIALFDLCAQAMNYTASTYAGPTLFAIIYSSVTVWTALFSRIILGRQLNSLQWLGVFVVFGGLCIAGWSSVELGEQVVHGCVLVTLGSAMHALTYVFSEGVMVKGTVNPTSNCAIQGGAACLILIGWQLVFTRRHWETLILEPISQQSSSYAHPWFVIALVLIGFGVANLVHALCYFMTLQKFPGGATSAGVMKGLQAVLVFVFSSVVYCGRLGGQEMCFSTLKLVSLVVVVGGVVVFGKATDEQRKRDGYQAVSNTNDGAVSLSEEGQHLLV